MLRDDIAKARFHYYEHFLRVGVHKAPSALEPRRPGAVPTAALSASGAWLQAQPPPRLVAAFAPRGVLPRPARHMCAASLPRPPSPARAASSRPASPGLLRSLGELSAGAGRPAPLGGPTRPARPTSAPPRLPGAGGAGAAADEEPLHGPLQRRGAVAPPGPLRRRRPRSAGPAYGSIYHGLGEACRTPGPGHYVSSDAATRLCANFDLAQPSPWSVAGLQFLERSPNTLDMYNSCLPTLGPGTYDVSSPPACVSKRSPQCNFAHLTEQRIPPDSGASPEEARFPCICTPDARFAHGCRRAPPDEGRTEDKARAWQQGLAVRCERPTAAICGNSREPRLSFQGAAFRLGGHLILPSGNEAGPCGVPAVVLSARMESLKRQRAKELSKATRHRRRPASAGGRTFGHSPRF